MKVIKIGATWCPACLIMKPRWQEIEQENPWLETEYYDGDKSADVLKKYEVEFLPSFIFLDKDGKEVYRLKGEISKKKIIEAINAYKDK